MNQGFFESTFTLLNKYDFQAGEDVSDGLKCIKCRRIIIKPCQVLCGCRFCHTCIYKLLINGVQTCPGNSPFCSLTNISHFQFDHSANKDISKIIVKCPETNCMNQCELMELEKHLKICRKQSQIENKDEIQSEKSNPFVDKQNRNQNKRLIESIIYFKNEITDLRTNENENKNTCEIIKQNIKLIKFENETIMDQDIQVLWERLVDIICNIITLIINEKHSNLSKIDRKCMKNHRSKTNTIRQNDKEIVMEVNRKSQILKTKIDKPFIWKIDRIDNLGMIGDIFSDYFYGMMEPYNMRLNLFTYNGFLRIYLCIFAGAEDSKLLWPFSAIVRIKLKTNISSKSSKVITNLCQIDRPNNIFCRHSDGFLFELSELSNIGWNFESSFFVHCKVDDN